MFQTIAVVVLLFLAVFGLGRHFWREYKAKQCENCALTKDAVQKTQGS